MEYLSDLLYKWADYVHFISFGLLILAGFNIPISEDLIIIISGSIAATILPRNTIYIFIGCFLGAYISDIIAYTLGRCLGPQLFKIKILRKLFSIEKEKKIETYFHKYHAKTLFFGRFIPFGIRNVLFFTAGYLKIKWLKFLLIDFSALIISSTIQFYAGYSLGKNFKLIEPYLARYKYIIFSIFVIIILFIYLEKKGFISFKLLRKKQGV